jgi:hypothetical protein
MLNCQKKGKKQHSKMSTPTGLKILNFGFVDIDQSEG